MSLSSNPKSQLAVDHEAKNCAEQVGRSLGAYLKTVGLVSDAYLAQVLVALWDSGLYEYIREHGHIEIWGVAEELNLEPAVLRSLIEYLVGWGILAPMVIRLSLAKKANLTGITSLAAS